MKHIILSGLLLACITLSCKNNASTTIVKADSHSQEVTRLLTEADNLRLTHADSILQFNDSAKHTSTYAKEIRLKLDSALTLAPNDRKVYLARISYLVFCKKFRQVLDVLREAEKKTSFSAELWNMKALLEDYYGDSLTAQKNYQSADSAYTIILKEHATDSLRYPVYRMNRTLNKALMTGNFAPFHEEVELLQQIHPEWKDINQLKWKNKKEVFDKLLGVVK